MTDIAAWDAPAENVVVHGADLDGRLEAALALVGRLAREGRRVYVYADHSKARFHDIVGTALVRRIGDLNACHVREILHAHYTDGHRAAVVLFGFEEAGVRNRPLNRLLRDPDITVVTVSASKQVAHDHRYTVRLAAPGFEVLRTGAPKGYVEAIFDEPEPEPEPQTWSQWIGFG